MNENEIDDGGPAFPIPLLRGEVWHGNGCPNGMTLRDYFAASIVQGMLASMSGAKIAPSTLDEVLQAIPGGAYWLADKMIEERKKKGDK